MKDRALVIVASVDSVHATLTARESGLHVVAFDGDPNATGGAYADEFHVVDISDVERTVAEARKIAPKMLLPVPIGRYITTHGAVNDALGLRGVTHAAALASADKWLFHERLSACGLRGIRCAPADSSLDMQDVPYPAIAKPRFGSGSRNVFAIDSAASLERARQAASGRQEDYVVEELIGGDEYGVDGAVAGGRFVLTLVRKKTLTPLPVRQALGYTSVMRSDDPELIARASSLLSRAAGEIGYDDCLFHADIIDGPHGTFIVEMSPRPSGHYLHDVFVPLATGVDPAREFITMQLGGTPHFEARRQRRLAIRFFNFEDTIVRSIPTAQQVRDAVEGVVAYDCRIRAGDRLSRVIDGHSVIGRGYFIVEGVDDAELDDRCARVLEMFETNDRYGG